MKSYTVSEPKFSKDIIIPEPTDTNHADNINSGPKQILQNTLVNRQDIEKLQEDTAQCESARMENPFPELYPQIEDTSYRRFYKWHCDLAYHNSIVRCKELGDRITYNQLQSLLGGDGKSPAAFIGDYWYIDGVYWYIAEILDGALVIMPSKGFEAYISEAEDDSWGMNTTKTTAGGYLGSYMVTDILPHILSTYIAPVFKNSLKEHVGYYTNAVTDGKASGYAEASRIIDVPNAVMLFGYPYNPAERTREHQLPLCRYRPDIVMQSNHGYGGYLSGTRYLRDIASDTKFAATSGGYLFERDAQSDRGGSVCPVFTIGLPSRYDMGKDENPIPYE